MKLRLNNQSHRSKMCFRKISVATTTTMSMRSAWWRRSGGSACLARCRQRIHTSRHRRQIKQNRRGPFRVWSLGALTSNVRKDPDCQIFTLEKRTTSDACVRWTGPTKDSIGRQKRPTWCCRVNPGGSPVRKRTAKFVNWGGGCWPWTLVRNFAEGAYAATVVGRN